MNYFLKQLKLLSIYSLIAFMLVGCAHDKNAVTGIQPITAIATETNRNQSEEQPVTIKVPTKDVVLWNLNLNDQGNEIVVKPSTVIQGKISYAYHCATCYKDLNNQILIGLAKRSAQACIYDGGPNHEGSAEFTLKAPAKPGRYEIRFRGIQSADCQTALRASWSDENSPPKKTTIGLIVASKKT